jgi:hypothetical protein
LVRETRCLGFGTIDGSLVSEYARKRPATITPEQLAAQKARQQEYQRKRRAK